MYGRVQMRMRRPRDGAWDGHGGGGACCGMETPRWELEWASQAGVAGQSSQSLPLTRQLNTGSAPRLLMSWGSAGPGAPLDLPRYRLVLIDRPRAGAVGKLGLRRLLPPSQHQLCNRHEASHDRCHERIHSLILAFFCFSLSITTQR
jgi:hypothetical protein